MVQSKQPPTSSLGGSGKDVNAHGRIMAELVDTAIEHLNQDSRIMIDKCQEYGLAHCSLNGKGFSSAIWDHYGDCVQAAISKIDPGRKQRPEASRAWVTLLSFIVENMKSGYIAGIRRSSQLAHTECPHPVATTLQHHPHDTTLS